MWEEVGASYRLSRQCHELHASCLIQPLCGKEVKIMENILQFCHCADWVSFWFKCSLTAIIVGVMGAALCIAHVFTTAT